jgi:hypothetical protein
MKQEHFYRNENRRYRVYDRLQPVGTDFMCVCDCSDEWIAKVIVYEMNKGLPYRPNVSYQEYVALKLANEIQ